MSDQARAPKGKLLVIAYSLGTLPREVGTIDKDQVKKFSASFDLATSIFHLIDEEGRLAGILGDPGRFRVMVLKTL